MESDDWSQSFGCLCRAVPLMRRVFLAIIVSTLLCGQSTLPAFPPGVFSQRGALDGTISYSGPGDVVTSALVWYGLRAYSAATRGNAAINVCNVSDVACADLSTDPNTGELIVSAIGGSSCAIVTCTVKILYDQSGNSRNITTATIANRAILKLNCIGAQPCLNFNASTQGYESTFSISQAQPVSISNVGYASAGMNFLGSYHSSAGAVGCGMFWDAANTWGIYADGTGAAVLTKSATDSSWHAAQAVCNGASSVLNIDGTDATGTTGNDSLAYHVSIGTDAFGSIVGGYWVESGLWSSGFSSGNRTAMCHNQYTYWGTSTSC